MEAQDSYSRLESTNRAKLKSLITLLDATANEDDEGKIPTLKSIAKIIMMLILQI